MHCSDPATGGFICSGFSGSRVLQVWSPPDLPRDLPGPTGAFVRYGEWRTLAGGAITLLGVEPVPPPPLAAALVAGTASGYALPDPLFAHGFD